MEIIVQKNAGFCFGVKRAVKISEESATERPAYTMGPLIHNPQEVGRLERVGVYVTDDYKVVDKQSRIIVRSHGETRQRKKEILDSGYELIDCTCPHLLHLYKKIQQKESEGYAIVIVGDSKHPEIIAMAGQLDSLPYIVNSIDEAKSLQQKTKLFVISQTTNRYEKFDEISKVIAENNDGVIIENTICSATKNRQELLRELAQEVDFIIVIGGRDSSNTEKLFQIAKKYKDAVKIENYKELPLQKVSKYNKIGITAGASTPDWIIEEVVNVMDNYSKDEFLEQVEESMNAIHPKEIIKGEVIYVTEEEVMVNIGYKADGIIKKDELSTDGDKQPKDLYKPGDEIEVYVIKLDDGEGNVVLSTSRVEGLKKWQELVDQFENQDLVSAEIFREVKGGLLSKVSGINAFIPGSQVTTHFVKDLSKYVGQTLECKILNIDEKKRRLVISRREVEEAEQKRKLDAAWENIEVGAVVTGTVQRLTDFGAFVDLGGVDGLLHISDISWQRIENPKDVLSEGQEVEVKILKANRERNRISLGIKQLIKRPFEQFAEDNQVGDIVNGQIVNLADFGAFVRLKEGVEGLVHVSEISYSHVEKPSDELNVGDEVEVKILEINPESKRIALSIKATKPEPQKQERKPKPKKIKPKKVEKPRVENEEDNINSDLGALLDLKLKEIEDNE